MRKGATALRKMRGIDKQRDKVEEGGLRAKERGNKCKDWPKAASRFADGSRKLPRCSVSLGVLARQTTDREMCDCWFESDK